MSTRSAIVEPQPSEGWGRSVSVLLSCGLKGLGLFPGERQAVSTCPAMVDDRTRRILYKRTESAP
jgi:hypothetical protein